MTDTLPTGKLPGWLEQVWLQRYLDRELTQGENEWFETYAIDKAALIEAIDTDNALRDAMHAWHADQLSKGRSTQASSQASSTTSASIHEEPAQYAVAARTLPHRATRVRWLRPLASAASLAIAAVLGAGASQWIGPGASAERSGIASPRRVVFDNLRGSESSAPMLESSTQTAAPLLIDVAVPPQAEAVVAHFADGSTLNLDVSSDGFVSLVGGAAELQRLSPIRLSYRSDGHSVERGLDLSGVL